MNYPSISWAVCAVRSLLYLLFLTITVIPYAVACLLWAPLPLPWRYRFTMGWPRLAIWGAWIFCGIRWQVRGWENLPNAPAVLLSKHQSAWETLFFPSHLPHLVCFVYKRALHWIPCFGWGLALLRMIPIDRDKGNGRSALAQLVQQGQHQLQAGRWPLLFPEGTRMAPGQTGRYKMGGVLLAARTGAWVVPIAHNAGECWPRRAFLKRPGLITVSIGPAIASQGKTTEVLQQQVKDWIEGEMRQLNPERYG